MYGVESMLITDKIYYFQSGLYLSNRSFDARCNSKVVGAACVILTHEECYTHLPTSHYCHCDL